MTPSIIVRSISFSCGNALNTNSIILLFMKLEILELLDIRTYIYIYVCMYVF